MPKYITFYEDTSNDFILKWEIPSDGNLLVNKNTYSSKVRLVKANGSRFNRDM
jgi:hypothetical protein